MAEEEAIFDASIKKKKKKKTGFNLDALDGPVSESQENGAAVPVEIDEPIIEEEKKRKSKNKVTFEDTTVDELVKDDFADLDLTGKKKKKSKKTKLVLDEFKETLADGENDENAAPNVEEFEMDFSKLKKKPKNKAKSERIDDLLVDDGARDDNDASRENDRSESWLDSDRDYTYEELFQRAFTLLREKNPEMAAGEKKRFIMKPPQVLRIGSKKTAFANFSDICRLLHRIPKHLLQFLLAELGTSGSIDGNNQLIIKGRFQQKQIENVLKRYIKEYVTCHTCRSPNTILQKDARLYFLQCEQCNSRCSVAIIKSGFQAVANKQQRQAIRASKN